MNRREPQRVAFDPAKPHKLRPEGGGPSIAYVHEAVGSDAAGGIEAIRARIAAAWNSTAVPRYLASNELHVARPDLWAPCHILHVYGVASGCVRWVIPPKQPLPPGTTITRIPASCCPIGTDRTVTEEKPHDQA